MNYLKRSTEILLITDDLEYSDVIQGIAGKLTAPKLKISSQFKLESGLKLIKNNSFDAILLDLPLRGNTSTNLLAEIKNYSGGTPLIVLIEKGNTELGKNAVADGASHFVLRSGLDATFLSFIISSSIEKNRVWRLLNDAQKKANIGYWEIDPETDRWISSGNIKSIFGKELNRLEEYLHAVEAEDQREVALNFMAALKEGRPFEVKHRITHPQEGSRKVRLSGNAERNYEGKVSHIYGYVTLVVEKAKIDEIRQDAPQKLEKQIVYANGHKNKPSNGPSNGIIKEPLILEKVTDINYLREVAGGDSSIMKKAISKFIETTPATMEKMDQYLKSEDYYQLAKCAHKLKSSVALMGMDEALRMVKHIEVSAKDQKGINELPSLVNQTQRIIQLSFKELEETLTSLQE